MSLIITRGFNGFTNLIYLLYLHISLIVLIIYTSHQLRIKSVYFFCFIIDYCFGHSSQGTFPLSAHQKDSEFECFMPKPCCFDFFEHHPKPIFSKQFGIIASIKHIFHTLFQSTTKIVYLLRYWFGNIFKQGNKVSQYLLFDSTIVF